MTDLTRQLTALGRPTGPTFDPRLLDEIDEQTFAAKNTELRDRIAELNLQVLASDQNRTERAEVAEKAFELSQSLEEKWFKADAVPSAICSESSV